MCRVEAIVRSGMAALLWSLITKALLGKKKQETGENDKHLRKKNCIHPIVHPIIRRLSDNGTKISAQCFVCRITPGYIIWGVHHLGNQTFDFISFHFDLTSFHLSKKKLKNALLLSRHPNSLMRVLFADFHTL